MKFDVISENIFQIYLNNLYIDVEKFNDKEGIYKILKSVLERIMKYYKIKFNGLYVMNIYIDKNIGTIIIVEKERDFEYLKSVDIKLKIYKDYNFKINLLDKDLLLDKDFDEINPLRIIEKIDFTI